MNQKNNILSVGWLSTGNGEGSLGLLKQGVDLHNEKKISIKYVFSNRLGASSSGKMENRNFKNSFASAIAFPV